MKIKILNALGEPVRRDELVTLFASDMEYDPFPRLATIDTDGTINLDVQESPVILHAKITVPGFGFMWIVADNKGAGYSNDDSIDFISEAADSRVYEVEALLLKTDFEPSAKCRSMLSNAKAMLNSAKNASNKHELNITALACAMWAGELAIVEKARHTIAQKSRRDSFLFGCGGFQYPYEDKPILKEVFDSIFNYATLPFYLARLEHEKGKPNYAPLDKLVDEFGKSGIETKAHPLWWTHTAGMPPWTENLKWEDGSIARELDRVVKRSVTRYKGRIRYYDVINEAHDWCNVYKLSQDQLVEMTKMCCDSVREADPKAITIINTCFMFGENIADNRVQWGLINERNMTPQSYLRKVHELGTDYDAIGVQLYFPARDMLAINKLYDRFSQFGKPLHLTELGVPSFDRDVYPNTTDGDIYCLRYMYSGLWREMGWSERLQADWLEDFYTISYARDEVEALTWWSISDNRSYVPASGLVDGNDTPKQAVFRLKELQKTWGFDL